MAFLKNELSNKNPYHLSKHRYLKLKHFCLQYPEWKDQLKEINDICSSNINRIKSTDLSREPERLMIERDRLLKRYKSLSELRGKQTKIFTNGLSLGLRRRSRLSILKQ